MLGRAVDVVRSALSRWWKYTREHNVWSKVAAGLIVAAIVGTVGVLLSGVVRLPNGDQSSRSLTLPSGSTTSDRDSTPTASSPPSTDGRESIQQRMRELERIHQERLRKDFGQRYMFLYVTPSGIEHPYVVPDSRIFDDEWDFALTEFSSVQFAIEGTPPFPYERPYASLFGDTYPVRLNNETGFTIVFPANNHDYEMRFEVLEAGRESAVVLVAAKGPDVPSMPTLPTLPLATLPPATLSTLPPWLRQPSLWDMLSDWLAPTPFDLEQ